MTEKQKKWLLKNNYNPSDFDEMTSKEIYKITSKPKISENSLLRCNKCSYVFEYKYLHNGLCNKCFLEDKYKENPVWVSLKIMKNNIEYLLQCNPKDICESKWANTIIDIGDNALWKTIPKLEEN